MPHLIKFINQSGDMKNLLFAIQILFIVFLVGYTNKVDYVGELKNEKPHGQGSIAYENGESYEGEWKDGLKVVKVLSLNLPEINMKGNGRMTKWRVRGLTPGLMEISMKGSGRMEKNMDKVIYFLKMEVKWSVSSKMIVPGKQYFMTNMLIFPPPTILLV